MDVFAFNPHSSPITQYFETEIVFPNYEGEEEEVLEAYQLKAFDALGNPLELEILDTEAPYLKAEFIQFTWGRKYRVGIKTSLPATGYQLIRVVETAIPLDLREHTLADATWKMIVIPFLGMIRAYKFEIKLLNYHFLILSHSNMYRIMVIRTPSAERQIQSIAHLPVPEPGKVSNQ